MKSILFNFHLANALTLLLNVSLSICSISILVNLGLYIINQKYMFS